MNQLADLVLLPFVLPAGLVLKAVRRIGLRRLRWCSKLLLRIGVLPIRRHYYEPFIDPGELRRPLDEERRLPGIDWNLSAQLQLLETLRYEGELTYLTAPRTSAIDFRLNNGSFESGDAEFLYQLIRARKPRRLFEIGSGNSTLIARDAIGRNAQESAGYSCKHVCVEPFEAPWLESAGVTVVRKRLEEVDPAMFAELEENDILFIDSSHVIRPQGDVLVEYLEILPALRPGVIVHIHDIFSPRDYPSEWVKDRILFWNEQYLLEGFLTQNDSWTILAAVNLLRHRHFEALRRVCPYLTPEREPGSFYMQKVR
ncbi:MAG TPA: class I SAM-dependent methyltransferase [Steroidobacteraceae bacterium]|nr:class I SAM-dependent methyltransferase [Steroidobacteraceae bacterium]